MTESERLTQNAPIKAAGMAARETHTSQTGKVYKANIQLNEPPNKQREHPKTPPLRRVDVEPAAIEALR